MADVPDSAVDQYCRVCFVDGGHKMAGYLPDRLKTEHEGKTYVFCSDGCKEKFDKDPAKYALTPEEAEGKPGSEDGHEGHDHSGQ